MTEIRKQEIIDRLSAIVSSFIPTDEEPVLTTHLLVCKYNELYDNPELIGGDWVLENTDIRLP